MSPKVVELLVGDTPLRLTGAHETYLDGVAATRQWGDTPLMRRIKSLPAGATYLDVGANIGLTAITAAVARPDLRIIAFEPVPSNANLLEQNVRANGISNCAVVHSAVGSEQGHLTMSDNGPWSVVSAGGVRVPVTTLDAYCAEHLAGVKIDLIKIDVEGYEPNVLANAQETIARWHPIVFMEFNAWVLVLAGTNPLAFARVLWEAFDVESDVGVPLADPARFAHDNMVLHGCVEDIVLRLRSPAALAAIGAVNQRATEIALRAEIDALRRSTSWRVTAPVRCAKTFLMRVGVYR